jgi:integrase
MNANDLSLRVECYVGLRRALGYAVHSEEKLLKDFVQFLSASDVTGPIRAQLAIDWACTPSPRRGPAGQASRLKLVRGFLSHLRAAVPETEVPGPGVLAPIRRPIPYLYSPDEIDALLKAASQLGPKQSLRPHTYVTLIGLLASTGLRVGEALRLKAEHVRVSHPIDWTQNKTSGGLLDGIGLTGFEGRQEA